MPGRSNHRRTLFDPLHLSDGFASGVDVQDFEDWIRLVWWTATGDNAQGPRRKIGCIVIPRSALPAIQQELRDSAGNPREGRKH